MSVAITDRQRRILDILAEDGSASVASISELLDVSAVTVRSDLNRLATAGQIVRTRGGAVPAYHPSILERRRRRPREKARIAKAAADLIQDGDNVMICAGTTTALMARYLLGKHDVHVVTNSTLLFPAARVSPSVRITLVGGEFRPSGEALVGPLTLRGLEEFHVKTAFLGTDGFSIDKGITAHLADIAEVVHRMAEQAARTVLLADSSKYGNVGFARILPLTRIDTIITDSGLRPADRRDVEALGIEVVTV
jgi:DeoR/GlpR family transcriptional regulator of sugar metabolism